MLINRIGTGGKQTVITKGRVDNRDVCWGSKEENHSTSSSSLLYCKTKHHLSLGIIDKNKIDANYKDLKLVNLFYLIFCHYRIDIVIGDFCMYLHHL